MNDERKVAVGVGVGLVVISAIVFAVSMAFIALEIFAINLVLGLFDGPALAWHWKTFAALFVINWVVRWLLRGGR